MKNLYAICVFLLLSCISYAQDLRNLSKNSYYTYIYLVPADSVYRLNNPKDEYSYDPTLSNFRLIDSFPTSTEYIKKLPVGYYFFVDIEDRRVIMRDHIVSNVLTSMLYDRRRNKLIIRSRDNHLLTDAIVTYRHKKYHYDKRAQAYLIPFSNEDGRALTIEAAGEKLFYDYSTDPREKPDWGDQINKKQRTRENKKTVKSNGYIVFNKPKYLPGDTVRLKAYLLHAKDKAYTQPLRIWVNMSDRYGAASYQTLAEKLEPVTPGAYVFEFVLTDSFQVDKDYDLSFVDARNDAKIRSESFRVEDYLLDKYTYTFEVDQKDWETPITDTIRMTAAGKDPNGMNVMDSKIRITALTDRVDQWYKDHECVPDTLFVMEQKLSATGDTKLTFPLEWLPDVRMNISISADFINAASEHQLFTRSALIDKNAMRLEVWQDADTIYAELMAGGHPVTGRGWLKAEGEDDDPLIDRAITFPFRTVVDAYAFDYEFSAYGADTLRRTFRPHAQPYLHYFRSDSTIVLIPDKSGIAVYYTIYHGKKILATGQLKDHLVTIPDRTQNEYEARIQYIFNGEPGYRQSMIGIAKNRLHVRLAQSDVVYPGKKDSVTVSITDNKGRPVPDANVTALSYTDQFHRGVYVNAGSGTRYLDNYERKRESELERVEDVSKDFDLGSCMYWMHRAHVDTMLYYQMVYPQQGIIQHGAPAPGLAAQFAPFIFDHGRSVAIHMIYVDGDLAYYDGAAAYIPYSLPVTEGLHNIALRTTDRLVRIDGIYFHDEIKTDLIMEWDSVKAKSDTLLPELSTTEKYVLRNRFIYYKQQRFNDTSYIWQQGNRLVFSIPPAYSGSSTQVYIPIGPLSWQMASFYAPHRFAVPFDPERNFAFSFAPAVSKLERMDLFSAKHISLQENTSLPLRFGELLRPHPAPDLTPLSVQKDLYTVGSMSSYRVHGSYQGALHVSIQSDSVIRYIRIYRADAMQYDRIFSYYREYGQVSELSPGTYDLMAITASGHYAVLHGVVIDALSLCHVKFNANKFALPDPVLRRYQSDTAFCDSAMSYIAPSGETGIAGRVVGGRGLGIPGASVILVDVTGVGTGRSTITDADGCYTLPGQEVGRFNLLIRATGYEDRIIRNITVHKNRYTYYAPRLRFDKNMLEAATIVAEKYNKHISEETVSMDVMKVSAISEVRYIGSDLVTAMGRAAKTTASAPQSAGINYQAIIRDAQGKVVTNTLVSMRVSIHDGSPDGTIVFQEIHERMTTSLGLFNTVIGTGNNIGGNALSKVNWNTLKYLQVEVDPAGGSDYTDLGTSNLMSVPYALYAGNSGVTQSDAGSALTINGGREDEVVYMVNGHRVVGKANVPVNAMKEISVLIEGVSASYGDTAAAVFLIDPIVEKYKDASRLRSGFRDYAYWEPNLITDENGQAKFAVKYPDNVTTWHSYAIGMNKKHQVGMAEALTRSYKDCMAELAVPQFLIAGDSSSAAIKITDYLHRPIPLTANFIWDGKKIQENDVVVNDILTDEVRIAVSPDEVKKEVKASFNISTAAGFGDGEEKSIAILPRGTNETKGTFALLKGDTSLEIPIDASLGQVTVRVESDILDILLDEVDHIRKYPYWCMEQSASRLVMLTMQEKIDSALHRPFKFQKEKKACIMKLQKGQLVNGSYGWWEYSPSSVRITSYVLSALGKAGVSAEFNTKDAYAYLDASLDLMSRDEQLSTMELYADRKWQPYRVMSVLHKIPFDSLSLYQKMQYYKAELLVGDADTFHHWDKIVARRQQTIFGGSYWGEDSWFWYSNQTSATVLAYEIAALRKDNALQEEIIQYFLEKRKHNGWRNTAESAKIVSAILPKVLADRKGDLSAPSVTIGGQGTISTFPYQAVFTPATSSLHVTKKGGGPVYFTAYQNVFNPSPDPVSGDFNINTAFQKNNTTPAHLTSGESSEIVVGINTQKYSEYLMIEIPIPAGCTYGPKPQGYGNGEVHREYFKDKVVIFCESFQPGHQEFRIPIESRYKGSYTVNPAKVQLMYFPTFFGRNGMKRVTIK